MKHIYINNRSDYTLIMLHGTGGFEEDMLGLAKRINIDANILSIRGNIVENGKNRFFKRFSVGVYDLDNYQLEIKNLIDNVIKFSQKYQFSLEKATVVGFSNGANIALGIIQENPIFNNYILYSPDYINKDRGFPDLVNKNIFISTAKDDPYVNFDNMEALIKILKNNNANLKVYMSYGHQINMNVLNDSIDFYNLIK